MKPFARWSGIGQNPEADAWVDLLSTRKPFRERGVWRIFSGLNYYDNKPYSITPKPFGSYKSGRGGWSPWAKNCHPIFASGIVKGVDYRTIPRGGRKYWANVRNFNRNLFGRKKT